MPVKTTFLAFVCGALLPLTLAPFDWWPLGLVSIGGWFWLLTRHPERALSLGFAYGIGKFGVGVSWVYVSMRLYGGASVPLAVLLVALFVAGLSLFTLFQAWLYRWATNRRGGVLLNAWLFAVAWVPCDWLLTWFLTGFPWLFPGYAHLQTPLANLMPLGGVHLASLGMVLTSVYLFAALAAPRQAPATHGRPHQAGVHSWRSKAFAQAFSKDFTPTAERPNHTGAHPGLTLTTPQRLAALVLAIVPWAAGHILETVEWVQPSTVHRVALVQGNIDQAEKWKPENRIPIISQYLDMTEPHWGTDLVIWPEAAVTLYEHQAQEVLGFLKDEGQASGTTVVLGIPTAEHLPDGEWLVYNSALATGTGSGRYSKRRLVPFGDYVPFEDLLRGLIRFFDLPMSSFTPGPKYQNGLKTGAGRAAVGICYEIAYGNLMRESAAAAAVLVTISNDTWFGTSIGPLQHMQIARVRALENGRWLLRGTNNGVTAIVDHRGRITSALPQFQRGVLAGGFQAMSGRTPYNRHGDGWLVTLCGVGLYRRPKAARTSSEA